MRFLATYKGALMVISHDLGLLDASITRILHLDRDGIVEYRGTYSQYRTSRARDEERLTKVSTRQEAEIKRLKRWPTRCAARPCDGPAWRNRSTRGAPSSSR